MAKNNNMWEFDVDTQLLSISNEDESYESQFQFKLVREKNSVTYEEKLVIECLENSNKNGVIVTDLLNIDKDIKKFLRYGVALSGIVYADIVQAIKNEYVKIEIEYNSNTSKMVTEEVIEGVISIVIEYFDECGYEGKTIDFPTAEFEELLKDTEYEEYDVKEIRKALAGKKYLITESDDRTSRLKRIDGKPVRVVSFDLEILQNLKKLKGQKKDA